MQETHGLNSLEHSDTKNSFQIVYISFSYAGTPTVGVGPS